MNITKDNTTKDIISYQTTTGCFHLLSIHYRLIILTFDYTHVYSELRIVSFKQTSNLKVGM